MAPARILERNVRAPKRVQEDDEEVSEEEEEEYEGLPGDAADESDGDEDELSGGGIDGEEDVIEQDEDDEDGDVEQQISSVSFGALKKAQDTLSRKRKRGSDESPEQDNKLEALRKRLRQIKEQKAAAALGAKPAPSTRVQTQSGDDSQDDSDDSDSTPSEEGAPSKSRTSKHAPAEQTSRHQVTRKRTVIDVPKRIIRDPRFDAVHQQTSSHPGNNNSEKAYSFLQDYQKAEIAELKAGLKRSKSEDDKITLRRKINSMENKLKAKAAKDREQEVISRHRKEEKGKVLEGKQPYYLKKKEVKERALVEKFKGMKGREREKVVEKRRLKEGQREKRRMPRDRRVAG